MAKIISPVNTASILVGTEFADEMYGNDLDDNLVGGGGIDTILGGTGNDSINGQSGSDLLYGGQGDDVILGGQGNDFISGDAGSDVLTGGQSMDTFAFNVKGDYLGNGIDTVTDFVLGFDKLAIVNGSSSNVTFVQDGADLDVYYDGTQIATLLTEVYTGNASDYLIMPA